MSRVPVGDGVGLVTAVGVVGLSTAAGVRTISTTAELSDQPPRVSPSGSRVGTGVAVFATVAMAITLAVGVALGSGIAVSVAVGLGTRVGLGGGVGVDDGKGGAIHEVADALARAVRVSGGGRSSDSFWATAVRVGEEARVLSSFRVTAVRVGEEAGVSVSCCASASVGRSPASSAIPNAAMRSDKGVGCLGERKERRFMPC